MLRDSLHDAIHQIQPELRSGSKWSAAKGVQEAEGSLQIKVVIGATQTGRAGLESTPHQWFSREDSRGHRDMVITELNMIKEKRVATVAGWSKETVMVFPDDYEWIPSPTCPSSFAPPTTSFPPPLGLTVTHFTSPDSIPWCMNVIDTVTFGAEYNIHKMKRKSNSLLNCILNTYMLAIPLFNAIL